MKWVQPNLRYYSGIFLEGLIKTAKNLRQYIWCPDRDLKLEPPKYKASVLTTRSRLSE
jgi:hypothetical protein